MTKIAEPELAASEAVAAVPLVEQLQGAGAPGVEPVDAAAPSSRFERRSLRRDSVYRRSLAVADVSAAVASLVVLRLVGGSPLSPLSVLALPLAVLLCKLLGLYDREERVLWSSTLDEAPHVVLMALVFTVIVWLAAGPFLPGQVHRGQFLMAFVTMAAGVLAGRIVARSAADALTERERCLVLGEASTFERVSKRLKFGEHGPAEVVLAIPLDAGGFERVAREGSLRDVLLRYDIHRVVIASSGHDTEQALELIRQAAGLDVKISVLPQFWETIGSLVVDETPGTAMLSVRHFGLSKSSEFVKRSFDVAAAGIALLVISPLMATIAVLIRATCGGPVLFRQRRVGRNGKPFDMFKFRSMCCDAEARRAGLADRNEAPGLFKMREDPRVTRVGRWLRRTSLDELPQLINVLKGDMSLVGPRPLVPEEDAGIVGWRRRRLDVAPGMTGHWQILGGPRVPLEEMVVIDYLYIANWSLWRDVKCLLRTVPWVLARRGI